MSGAGAAWLGKILPIDPGGATAAFKTLGGVEVVALTDTQKSNIAGDGESHGDGGNHYTRVGGVNVTRWGKMFSGEYIDLVRDVDFLEARIAEDVFQKIASLPKIPYTDGGVAIITGVIQARLESAERAGILAPGSSFVRAPSVASISSNDRGNRLLPDVEFGGTLQGAIHKVRINGRLAI
jgi:hypothetical protein